MKQYVRNAIVGKTIKSVKEEMYNTQITITFTDKSVLTIIPGSAAIHNDRWDTVKMELKDAIANTD